MEMDIDPEIEAMVEEAITQLRKKLGPDELKVYERYYEDFRTASKDVRYYNAYRILRRYLAEVG
jgi:hypothetical protein